MNSLIVLLQVYLSDFEAPVDSSAEKWCR
jgi:hypothetical protein